jgi:hypothetical protein
MNLDQIREKLEKLQNRGKTNNGFWKVPLGESIIRICPNPKGGDSFLDFHMHYGVGKNSGFLCPKRNFQEQCAVCSFASQLWAEGGDSLEMAKKFFAKQRFYSPVLVRGDEKKSIKWWSYSETVYKKLLGLGKNPDYGDIENPEKGYDLVVTSSIAKGKRYADTDVNPRRLSSRFCDDLTPEECQALFENMVDIRDLLERKTPAQVKEALDAHLISTDKDAEEASKESEKFGAKPTPESSSEEEKNSIDKAFDELGV